MKNDFLRVNLLKHDENAMLSLRTRRMDSPPHRRPTSSAWTPRSANKREGEGHVRREISSLGFMARLWGTWDQVGIARAIGVSFF